MGNFFCATEKPINRDNPYHGFKGLNIDEYGFQEQVMSRESVSALFAKESKYTTPYVYPPTLAETFGKPVTFSAKETEQGIFLTGSITSGDGFIVKCLLPEQFIANDDLVFIEEPGFGPGSVKITSAGFYNPNGEEVLKSMGVENRPGLFLKISNSTGNQYYEDMAIFFPAQIDGISHYTVRHGEAFVLVREGVDLDNDRIKDIDTSFTRLVKKSYGVDQGLISIETGKPIEDYISLNNRTI